MVQLKVTNRHAQAAPRRAYEAFQKPTLLPSDSSVDAEWVDVCKGLHKALSRASSPGRCDAEFQGDAATFQVTLLLMMNDMSDLEF